MDALYLADSEETAWAEWYRPPCRACIPQLAQMARDLWTWLVDVEVADLSTDHALADVALKPPLPSRHDALSNMWASRSIVKVGEVWSP